MSEPTKGRLQPVEILQYLEAAGHRALIVGGFVRDSLLGQRPEDADIATSANPEQVMALFQGKAILKQQGKQFGVVTVDGIEVAMFRGEHYLIPGRPEVCPVDDFARDASRRDFTINAMGMTAAGEIVDPIGGLHDLRAGVIRAVGDPDTRFREDPARLLRAATFAARLDFAIEEGTAAAIRRQADLAANLPRERIAKELGKMIERHVLHRGLALLDELLLLPWVLPALAHLPAVKLSEISPWASTLQTVQAAEAVAAPPAVIWAATFQWCALGLVPGPQSAHTSAQRAYHTVLHLQGGKSVAGIVALLIRVQSVRLPLTAQQALRVLRLLSIRYPDRQKLTSFLADLFVLLRATIAGLPPGQRRRRRDTIVTTERLVERILAKVPLYPREAGIDGSTLGLKGPQAGTTIRQMLYRVQDRVLSEVASDC